jgi:hypothetical protein
MLTSLSTTSKELIISRRKAQKKAFNQVLSHFKWGIPLS